MAWIIAQATNHWFVWPLFDNMQAARIQADNCCCFKHQPFSYFLKLSLQCCVLRDLDLSVLRVGLSCLTTTLSSLTFYMCITLRVYDYPNYITVSLKALIMSRPIIK